uniref:Uncharacterized protein n=1 Tax=Electrophorus electricus TaxID=8005 RepID=A0A4W4DVP8_ELEEL
MKMQYTQHIDQTTETYPEVVGIHVEFFRVDSAQRSVGTLDVVQVLHAFVQSTHDDFTVRRHFGVPHNGRGAGYVTKGSEVSLCPWVYNQKPETRESIILKEELGMSPQVNDSTTLGFCQLNHSDVLGAFFKLPS